VHVQARPREVRHATGVIEVEMSQDDVADFLRVMPKTLELANGGVPGIPVEAEVDGKQSHLQTGFRVVVHAETGVDEHDAPVRLDDKAHAA
jgi:hypothetical protein